MTMFRHDHGMIMTRSCLGGHVFPTRVGCDQPTESLCYSNLRKGQIQKTEVSQGVRGECYATTSMRKVDLILEFNFLSSSNFLSLSAAGD